MAKKATAKKVTEEKKPSVKKSSVKKVTEEKKPSDKNLSVQDKNTIEKLKQLNYTHKIRTAHL